MNQNNSTSLFPFNPASKAIKDRPHIIYLFCQVHTHSQLVLVYKQSIRIDFCFNFFLPEQGILLKLLLFTQQNVQVVLLNSVLLPRSLKSFCLDAMLLRKTFDNWTFDSEAGLGIGNFFFHNFLSHTFVPATTNNSLLGVKRKKKVK